MLREINPPRLIPHFLNRFPEVFEKDGEGTPMQNVATPQKIWLADHHQMMRVAFGRGRQSIPKIRNLFIGTPLGRPTCFALQIELESSPKHVNVIDQVSFCRVSPT